MFKSLIKKRRFVNLFGGVIILVISLLLLLFLLLYSNSEMERTALRELEESADDKQTELNSTFTTIQNNMLSMAIALTSANVDVDGVAVFLSEQNYLFKFNSLYYVDTEGDGVSYNGEIVNMREDIIGIESTFGIVNISYPYVNEAIGSEVLKLITPVIRHGGIAGYVIAEYSLSDIAQSLSNEVSQYGYALFTNSEGIDFFSTDVEFIPLEDLAGATFENGSKSIDEVLMHLSEGTEGHLSFTLNSIPIVSVYKPLNINGWNLVLAVNREDYISNIRILSTVLTVFVLSVFAALSFSALLFYNAKKTVERVAYYDDLTGLPNLAKFKKDVLATITANPEKSFTVVKMDIQNFKAINELYDFEVGDRTLRTIAIASKVAKTKEKTFIMARTGADEFMMFAGNNFLDLLPDYLPVVIKRYKELVPELSNHHLVLKYGRYVIEKSEKDINNIVSKVGMAHSSAKDIKGVMVWDYDDDYKNNIIKRTEITNKMEAALIEGEFVAYLQPKVSTKNNNTVAAEALVRWVEADGKMIYPGDFIPVFEGNGFITSLDKHILKCVCETLSSWKDRGFDCIPISVNFSRLHFNDPEFLDEIIQIVDGYNIERKFIEVELTETMIFDNEEAMKKLILQLSTAGFSTSIDDFGSGYSSLGMLKSIKANTIKLDRSFLINSDDNLHGDTVIDSVVKLAHSIGMEVVAEGVETAEQAEFLKRINCDLIQGYFYEKPITVAKFEEQYLQKKLYS